VTHQDLHGIVHPTKETSFTMKRDAVVFIVDDDEAVRRSLTMKLRSAGLRVIAFASIRAFMDYYEHDECGCVLVDIRLRGEDGLELVRTLKARRSRMPVIILTGSISTALRTRAMREGVFDVVEKNSFFSRHLIARIESALKHYPQG